MEFTENDLEMGNKILCDSRSVLREIRSGLRDLRSAMAPLMRVHKFKQKEALRELGKRAKKLNIKIPKAVDRYTEADRYDTVYAGYFYAPNQIKQAVSEIKNDKIREKVMSIYSAVFPNEKSDPLDGKFIKHFPLDPAMASLLARLDVNDDNANVWK